MQRINHLTLPSSSEMDKLLAIGQYRKLPVFKKSVHYAKFLPVKKLLDTAGINTDFFDLNLSKEEFSFLYKTKLEREIQKITNVMIDFILNSKSNLNIDLYNEVYSYLSEEDELYEADLIFVFGAKSTIRVKKAVEIFKKGFAPLLVLSGGYPLYIKDQKTPEAIRDKRYAIKHGVPEERIIVEPYSVTMSDNVRSSLNMLEHLNINFRSAILVNSPYTQRRGWVYFRKYLKRKINLIRINSETKKVTTRDYWYKNERGIRLVLNEFFKMKVATFLNTG